MGTILLNADLAWNNRVAEVGNAAYGAWVKAVAWCSRRGGGLDIPKRDARGLAPLRLWRRLQKAGMVEKTSDAWLVLNFECRVGEVAFKFCREDWSRHAVAFVMERDGRTCRYCGARSSPLSIDHVIPRSRGGPDCASNLVVACRSCNSRKGARTPEQARMPLRPIGDA